MVMKMMRCQAWRMIPTNSEMVAHPITNNAAITPSKISKVMNQVSLHRETKTVSAEPLKSTRVVGKKTQW